MNQEGHFSHLSLLSNSDHLNDFSCVKFLLKKKYKKIIPVDIYHHSMAPIK